jgi:endonuclease YncB( thermonuclease family)
MLVAAAALLVFMTPADADIAGVASVTDADTIEIHGQRMRLYGVDAPESCQTCIDAFGRTWRCGQRAARAAGPDLPRTVTCSERDIDRCGRIVARQGETDIGEWLVGQGLAPAYRRCSEAYIPAEQAASAARRGRFRRFAREIRSGERDEP